MYRLFALVPDYCPSFAVIYMDNIYIYKLLIPLLNTSMLVSTKVFCRNYLESEVSAQF